MHDFLTKFYLVTYFNDCVTVINNWRCIILLVERSSIILRKPLSALLYQ